MGFRPHLFLKLKSMTMAKLHSKNVQKIISLVNKHMTSDETIYSINIVKGINETTNLTFQGYYKANLVGILKKKGFKFSFSDMGYIYAEKQVAKINIQFTLTD